MDIFFTHFYGRMSDVMGIINCGAYAVNVSVDDEHHALEKGWTTVESAFKNQRDYGIKVDKQG